MPESTWSGEKIEIHAYQDPSDVTTLLGYTSGDVSLEPTTDIIEAEVHSAKRKLRKTGKETVDVVFSGLVTTTIPALAMLGLSTGSAPQTLKFSGDELTKILVKVFLKEGDSTPDATLTLNGVIPLLEGLTISPGGDFARFNLRGIVNGAVTLG